MKRMLATRSMTARSTSSSSTVYTSKNGLKLPMHMLGLNVDVDGTVECPVVPVVQKSNKKQKVW